MRYLVKLYPDSVSKEGNKIIELEADDAELEELSAECTVLQFTKKVDKTHITVYGVDFSKVVEFYAIPNLIKSEEFGNSVKSNTSKFKVIEFKKDIK